MSSRIIGQIANRSGVMFILVYGIGNFNVSKVDALGKAIILKIKHLWLPSCCLYGIDIVAINFLTDYQEE